MNPDMLRRQKATEQTLSMFQHEPFSWSGKTCIHLARAQLVHMGHRPRPIPMFRSPLGAKRALKKAGYEVMADIFDQMDLPIIAPARMLPGDLGIMEGYDGFDGVVICAGHKLMTWYEDGSKGLSSIGRALAHVKKAWRL